MPELTRDISLTVLAVDAPLDYALKENVKTVSGVEARSDTGLKPRVTEMVTKAWRIPSYPKPALEISTSMNT